MPAPPTDVYKRQGQNIRDYLSAIDDVAREPWADRERMGCVGASYGCLLYTSRCV